MRGVADESLRVGIFQVASETPSREPDVDLVSGGKQHVGQRQPGSTHTLLGLLDRITEVG